MNEPASFVHGTVGGQCLGDPLLENPPYMPRKNTNLSFSFLRVIIYLLSCDVNNKNL